MIWAFLWDFEINEVVFLCVSHCNYIYGLLCRFLESMCHLHLICGIPASPAVVFRMRYIFYGWRYKWLGIKPLTMNPNPTGLVLGVSHINTYDWLVKNMTDDTTWVDLERLNDWQRLAMNVTDSSDCIVDFYVENKPAGCCCLVFPLELCPKLCT